VSARVPSPGEALRVLYVCGTGAVGGAVRSLRFLIESFPEGSVEPHVVCCDGPALSEFRRMGLEVSRVRGVSSFVNTAGGPLRGLRHLTLLRTLFHLRHGAELRSVFRAVRPHIVHVNEWFYLQAVAIAAEQGIPVVLHARSTQERDVRWATQLAEAFIDRHVDLLVPIDESVRRSLRGVARSRIVYNPLPTVPPEFTPRAEPGRTRVTFLTGLMSQKGVDELIACAKLLSDRRDIVFTIHGENPRPRDFYRSLAGRACSTLGLTRDAESDLRARVERDRLGDTVLLAGAVNPEREALSTTDILVFPSRMNGVGRSVFEAGIHGIPSIVALRDRVEDIVEDGRTGLIVPERDPAALARAVRTLADDPVLRAEMGAAAREKYRRQFDPARVAEEMLEVYRELLRDRARKPVHVH
jgi:glycosyltransferase involved in cell wall biosynthesis